MEETSGLLFPNMLEISMKSWSLIVIINKKHVTQFCDWRDSSDSLVFLKFLLFHVESSPWTLFWFSPPPPPQPYFPHHLYQLPRPLVASYPSYIAPRPFAKNCFPRDTAAVSTTHTRVLFILSVFNIRSQMVLTAEMFFYCLNLILFCRPAESHDSLSVL